ncbi:Fibrobacter succinogene major paralogous domain protein, partial [Hoylesella marshii DSM 16973 = JCM 13450]
LEDNDPAHPSPAPNTITIPLTGKKAWKPGTSKLYKLSQNTSDWTFHLTVTQPSAAAYNATQTGNYGISSYREAPDGTQRPVAWRVVKYQESTDGGATWSAESDTKPAWLTSLSLTQGNGSTAAQQGSATVQKAPIIDKLAPYNKVLHDATPKGSPTSYYNLSNSTGAATVENTANSYLISASGYYKIPLVYGNAIKNGGNNTHAYISNAAPGNPNVLYHFKDHAGVDIDNPWITQTHGGVNTPDGAKIVWTDQSGIVDAGSLGIEGSGANAFVHFRVPQDKIKNGNAVIAVTKGSTVVWSWHLWFDHGDVLDVIPCTNFQGYTYKFTKQTLGSAYRKWDGSAYNKPRVARVKVEQTIGNNGAKQFAYIDIKQNPNSVKEISSTYYQFGRKDAFPGTDTTPDGSFNKNGGDNMSIQNGIQHPETFYPYGSTWNSGYNQYNLWSMDNTVTGYNDNAVVKTVYDPCPAGFKMPASNAFTGFTTNGQNGGTKNVSGAWDYGWNFNNKISSPDATVYFPASGYRDYNGGSLYDVGYYGFYWSAVPRNSNNGCILYFGSGFVYPQNNYHPSVGFSVRPVADE